MYFIYYDPVSLIKPGAIPAGLHPASALIPTVTQLLRNAPAPAEDRTVTWSLEEHFL